MEKIVELAYLLIVAQILKYREFSAQQSTIFRNIITEIIALFTGLANIAEKKEKEILYLELWISK